jgi:N utilization substance protein B
MTRTAARELAVQLSYSLAAKGDAGLDEFFDEEYYATLAGEDALFASYPDEKQMLYIRELVLGVQECRAELDGYIEKYTRGWRLPRISRIAAAVLRCAMYEILYMPEVPDAAAINEAVELSKGYEEAETVAFINGILGSFVRGELGVELERAEPNDAVEPDDTAASDETAEEPRGVGAEPEE